MTSLSHTLTLGPEQGFSRYLSEIASFPMLEKEEEFMLAERLHHHQDTDAAKTLITSHLRLVAKIAMGFRGYGLPIGDIVSEGNIGLMQAVRKFDPSRGFRLATYAMWWIRSAIQEYVLRSWSLVRIGSSAAHKKLFFGLRRTKKEISALEEGDLRPDNAAAIAERLGVKDEDVVFMNRRMIARDASLNAPARRELDSTTEWQDLLADDQQIDQAEAFAEHDLLQTRRGSLETALATLAERERHILTERRLKENPLTLEKLAGIYGVSCERIRQIEKRAFEKLQKAMCH